MASQNEILLVAVFCRLGVIKLDYGILGKDLGLSREAARNRWVRFQAKIMKSANSTITSAGNGDTATPQTPPQTPSPGKRKCGTAVGKTASIKKRKTAMSEDSHEAELSADIEREIQQTLDGSKSGSSRGACLLKIPGSIDVGRSPQTPPSCTESVRTLATGAILQRWKLTMASENQIMATVLSELCHQADFQRLAGDIGLSNSEAARSRWRRLKAKLDESVAGSPKNSPSKTLATSPSPRKEAAEKNGNRKCERVADKDDIEDNDNHGLGEKDEKKHTGKEKRGRGRPGRAVGVRRKILVPDEDYEDDEEEGQSEILGDDITEDTD
ncbi:hypothetical protein BKA64DRAFT_645549 [Cadophora sp. MPI-SDFR-AT-0126]|nr:hypothetical protein BKA64DRAFT_645549 [Leotiomycetes sp. MPI-SDFR-AT-0126]